MAKKRRVTTDQAWMLAVSMLCRTMDSWYSSGNHEDAQSIVQSLFKDHLPEKWFDGQTSDQSWQHVMEETNIQVMNIVDCLSKEARKVQAENPGFKV